MSTAASQYTMRNDDNYTLAKAAIIRNPAMDNLITSIEFYPVENINLSLELVAQFREQCFEWTREILMLEDYQPKEVSNTHYAYTPVVPYVIANIDNTVFSVALNKQTEVPVPKFGFMGKSIDSPNVSFGAFQ